MCLRGIDRDAFTLSFARYFFKASEVLRKGGRTRTDKIGVGAGADIGGTGISCNFMARQ
jgi:hypothetical protein